MASIVPELPEQWENLDIVKILAQPAAFISISQCNSLYRPEGVQGGEKQWERGHVGKHDKSCECVPESRYEVLLDWIRRIS